MSKIAEDFIGVRIVTLTLAFSSLWIHNDQWKSGENVAEIRGIQRRLMILSSVDVKFFSVAFIYVFMLY